MSILDFLENGLFALGQVLRFPVMALLWVCVGFVLYYCGQTLVIVVGKRARGTRFDIKRWLSRGDVLTAPSQRLDALPEGLKNMVASIQAQAANGSLANGGLENIIYEHEDGFRRSIHGLRSLVKIGPSLGLIGTLIPMGSSLAAMAGGNLQAMSGQMVVAFTTTIIGIAVGTLAYVLAAIRQGGVDTTIREARYLAEHVAAEMEGRNG